MTFHVGDVQQPPFPEPAPPHQPEPEPAGAAAPMIYVYEKQRWEYKVVTVGERERPLSDQELNTLGKDGWELAGVVNAGSEVRFYFKRPCD